MSEIITRKEALSKGLKRYFTGMLCQNGHLSERYTNNHICAECAKKHAAQWRKDNLMLNRESVNISARKWCKNNPHKNAAKLHRTPIWLTKMDLKKIEGVYIFAQLL